MASDVDDPDPDRDPNFASLRDTNVRLAWSEVQMKDTIHDMQSISIAVTYSPPTMRRSRAKPWPTPTKLCSSTSSNASRSAARPLDSTVSSTSLVNPVKDQGQCGSCWAFSAVGTVESGYALAAGKLGSYSEQQLVDCDTSRSQGCSGGFNQYGIQYIGQTGSCSESAYPYKAADGTCTASSCSKSLSAGTVTGYNSVTGSNAGLESALNQQPVSVTMKADNTWQSYRSGVVSENCGFLARPNHAIIAVGYDGDNFKIRNSWGASWGEGGYIRVAKSTSNPFCIWSTTPFVPTISADVTV